MTDEQALEQFRRWVDVFGKKYEAAEALGVSRPYLVDLYRGTRPLTDRLLEHIGLKREVTIKRRTA